MGSHQSISGHLKQKFYDNLTSLAESTPLLADQHAKKLLSNLDILSESEEGIRFLYEKINELLEAGILNDTMWEDPAKLVPSLVGGTLKAGDQSTIYEILSELRMAAIANEKITSKGFRAGKARTFLEDALVNNLEWMFRDAAGENKSLDDSTQKKIAFLFGFLSDQVSIENIKARLATEIELICQQRPIVTDRVLQIIRIVHDHIVLSAGNKDDDRLQFYVQAVYTPSQKAGELDLDAYSEYLKQARKKEIEYECDQLAVTMRDTGLAVGYHAVLLRHVAGNTGLVKRALGLGNGGKAELDKHKQFVRELIRTTIHPDTARSCYGLAKLLERSLLSHQPVKNGLQRIMALELHPKVAEAIRKSRRKTTLAPKHILAAECLGILGQPLGIGQGWNPTCQSARGISLWSSHAPGKLLRMIESAAKSNNLSMRFEGNIIRSEEVLTGLTKKFDFNLDAVSVVLVPHLDKIYNEMMTRASNRPDDPHKWVNPAMYGHWIPTGFISTYDSVTNSIKNYEEFIRTFYATHHPKYNGGHDLAYPNPVGIFLTSSTGKLIGFHAVSILRVKKVKGHTRVYILNPNNEGRQRWQSDIRPTVAGNGERPGESSLPFHQFASRLYAFHFNRSDLNDLDGIDSEEVEKVKKIARNSWGTSYTWIEPREVTL